MKSITLFFLPFSSLRVRQKKRYFFSGTIYYSTVKQAAADVYIEPDNAGARMCLLLCTFISIFYLSALVYVVSIAWLIMYRQEHMHTKVKAPAKPC